MAFICFVAGVEHAESWYRKPMPKERADAIIKLIESQIETNQSLMPQPPIEDSPQINIVDIKMTSLPVYKVGDMVRKNTDNQLSPVHQHALFSGFLP
jgi:transketolase